MLEVDKKFSRRSFSYELDIQFTWCEFVCVNITTTTIIITIIITTTTITNIITTTTTNSLVG